MAFVTQGYVNPCGVISKDLSNKCNGVKADGSPELLSKVEGNWVCSGHFVGAEDINTTTEPIVYTTQYCDFKRFRSKKFVSPSLSG